mgnify:CR=1 FL=1
MNLQRLPLWNLEDGRFADYSFKQLEELELAYAITIHKSQAQNIRQLFCRSFPAPRC